MPERRDDPDMVESLSAGMSNAVVKDSKELFGKHTKEANDGEVTRQDPFDPTLQSRLTCAIVDAEAEAIGEPTLEGLVKIGSKAGLTSDTFLRMLDDNDFQIKLDEMRWSVLVTLRMGGLYKAAMDAAIQDADTRAITKILDYNEKRTARRAQMQKDLLATGTRDQIIDYMRDQRNRLSRLIEALEDSADIDDKEDKAKAILDEMEDPDRKLDPDGVW